MLFKKTQFHTTLFKTTTFLKSTIWKSWTKLTHSNKRPRTVFHHVGLEVGTKFCKKRNPGVLPYKLHQSHGQTPLNNIFVSLLSDMPFYNHEQVLRLAALKKLPPIWYYHRILTNGKFLIVTSLLLCYMDYMFLKK